MSKKRLERPISGVLLFYKPREMSSNASLQRVRRLFQAEKAGHGGTLDPFAEGLLPLLLGEATKFGQYVLHADKGYRVTVSFGTETTTDDSTGEPVRTASIPTLTQLDWSSVLASFLGTQMQIPPIYSALKIAGQRAYDLARAGENPTMTAREVTFFRLDLVAVHDTSIILDVACSKGTYIRALARDLGRKIGSAAHASALQRLFVGSFGRGAEKIYAWEELSARNEEGGLAALDACLLPLSHCLTDLPKISIPAAKIRFIRHGNDIALPEATNGQYALYDGEEFFGVGTARDGRIYPDRLCRLPNA